MTFVFGGLVQTVGRICRKHFRPLFLSTSKSSSLPRFKPVYDVVGTICSVLLLNFTCAPFMLLTISASLKGWKSLGLYGFWMMGAALIFFYGGGFWLLGKVQAQIALQDQVISTVKKPSKQRCPPSVPHPDVASDDMGIELKKLIK